MLKSESICHDNEMSLLFLLKNVYTMKRYKGKVERQFRLIMKIKKTEQVLDEMFG